MCSFPSSRMFVSRWNLSWSVGRGRSCSPFVVRCLACLSSFCGDVLFLKRFMLLFFRNCKCKMFKDYTNTEYTVSLVSSRLWSWLFSLALLLCFSFTVVFYVFLHLLLKILMARLFSDCHCVTVRLSPFALSVWQLWPAVPAETSLRIVIPNFIHGIILVMYLLNILIPESVCDSSFSFDFSSASNGKFHTEKNHIKGFDSFEGS